jgi:hypothetical protein
VDTLVDLVGTPSPLRFGNSLDSRDRPMVAAGSAEQPGPCPVTLSPEEIGRALARPLEAFGPDVICTIFDYEAQSDELVASHVSNAAYAFLLGVRMPLGDRVSGWVAATRRTIVNSDPVLDLGSLAEVPKPRFHRSLVTPIVAADQLIGVCALYSSDPRGFSEEHARWLELLMNDLVSRQGVAAPVATATQAGRPRLVRRPQVPSIMIPYDQPRLKPVGKLVNG